MGDERLHRLADPRRRRIAQGLSRRPATGRGAISFSLFGAEPVDERVVFDRNRVTGGGVTAGIDFALALIASDPRRGSCEDAAARLRI